MISNINTVRVIVSITITCILLVMIKVLPHTTKTLTIKKNWRSADFVTPNFLYGCMGWCRASYCYVMRYNHDKVYVAKNRKQILEWVWAHASLLQRPKPTNQTDPTYRTYDIWCSSDLSLHRWLIQWTKIFDYFIRNDRIKATFATKYVNSKLLAINPNQKVRIRFSLMPQAISSILEPNTASIQERIDAISLFQQAWYEVHLNFSPIVLYKWWRKDYEELFTLVAHASTWFERDKVLCEAIFVTHNESQHYRNLANGNEKAEELLWQPNYQEWKVSQFGSSAIRYERTLKARYIQEWKSMHDRVLPWNTIRYIF